MMPDFTKVMDVDNDEMEALLRGEVLCTRCEFKAVDEEGKMCDDCYEEECIYDASVIRAEQLNEQSFEDRAEHSFEDYADRF